MIQQGLEPILFVEFTASIIGFTLLFFEIHQIFPSLSKKGEGRSILLALLSILVFTNFIYLTRTLGIYFNNPSLRQIGAVISGLLTTSSLVIWGSLATHQSRGRLMTGIFGLTTGTILFILGIILTNINLLIYGIIFLATIPLISLFWLYKFIFIKSPYVLAKKRILLMTISGTMLILLEGLSVFLMNNDRYLLAAIFFSFEIPARMLMTLSIFLPKKVQLFLTRIIH